VPLYDELGSGRASLGAPRGDGERSRLGLWGRINDCPCESGIDRFTCPCCRFVTLEVSWGTAEYEICPVCFWQHNHVVEADPTRSGGPTPISLAQARENYREFGAVQRRFIAHVRPPRIDERSSAP
jgi:hypothetical protein